MPITAEEFRAILDDKLDPIKRDCSDIKKTLYGDDGMGGVVGIAKDAHGKSNEHEILLRGKNKRNGLVSDVASFKRLWVYLGTGGAVGSFLEWFKRLYQ